MQRSSFIYSQIENYSNILYAHLCNKIGNAV